MGVLLRWQLPDGGTYNTARIYRSTASTGPFNQIASQTIADNTYFDTGGDNSYWYRVDFYDSVTGNASAMSDPSQGNTTYGYCSVEEVRSMTGLTSTRVSDSDLFRLIMFAGTQLNADISIYNEEEVINYIDETKQNDIDGTNNIFYTQNYPLGDSNNDFKVTTADVTLYQIASDGTRTTLTLTQVSPSTGQIISSTAPSGDVTLKVTYRSVLRDVNTPDTLVKLACIMLTASMAYSKLEIGKASQFKSGSFYIKRDSDAHEKYLKKYNSLISRINDRTNMFIEADPSTLF